MPGEPLTNFYCETRAHALWASETAYAPMSLVDRGTLYKQAEDGPEVPTAPGQPFCPVQVPDGDSGTFTCGSRVVAAGELCDAGTVLVW